jgi:hypothetical protein
VATGLPLKSDGDDPLVFGAIDAPCCGGFVNHFNGDLDEIRLYNMALSEEEILELGPPPEIRVVSGPENWIVPKGVKEQLSVSAYGTAGLQLTYQWQVNGQPIDGATNSELTASNNIPGIYTYRVLLEARGMQALTPEGTIRVVENTAPRLVAHWALDEPSGDILKDDSGVFDLTITNAFHVGGRVGGGALEFQRTESFGTVEAENSDLELVGRPYTIAWWMKLGSGSSTRTVLNMQNRLDASRPGWFIDASPSQIIAGHGKSLWVVNPGVQMANWNHFALVFDGAKRTLYVNGAVRSSSPTLNQFVSRGLEPLSIGGRESALSGLQGSLDDVRIYNYALATDEIQGLLFAPQPPTLMLNRDPDGTFFLGWKNFSTNNFRLEFTDQLGATWTPSGSIPIVSGDTSTVIFNAPEGSRFYRLRKL